MGFGGKCAPQARYDYRALLFDIQNVDVFYLAEEGVFMQAGDRTFIIDELDRGSNAFRRAFIFQDKGDKGSETVTSSRGFLYDAPEEGKRPILRLEEGHRLLLPRPPGRPGEADANAEVTEFAVADTPMGRVSKDIFRPRGIDERELTLPELFVHLDDPPEDATAAEVSSELNEMLVIAVSMLILPFLAIPFAVGSRRSPRSFRMGFALVLIVVYNEVIQQGSNVAQREVASSFVVMWIPCILLALFAFWRYYTTCFTLKADLLAAGLDRMGEAFTSFRHRLMRRTGLEEAR